MYDVKENFSPPWQGHYHQETESTTDPSLIRFPRNRGERGRETKAG